MIFVIFSLISNAQIKNYKIIGSMNFNEKNSSNILNISDEKLDTLNKKIIILKTKTNFKIEKIDESTVKLINLKTGKFEFFKQTYSSQLEIDCHLQELCQRDEFRKNILPLLVQRANANFEIIKYCFTVKCNGVLVSSELLSIYPDYYYNYPGNMISPNCNFDLFNANFYLEQYKTNGQTIIINTVPVIMNGVEHFWGIVYNGKTPNCNCSCDDIPLCSIINAKTEGVFATNINSNGIFTNLGIGTNVTSGSSNFGIKYGGFPYSGCYKITHYIVCDKLIKSFTTCINQSDKN